MRLRLLAAVAVLSLCAGTAAAETLGELLRARGVPPSDRLGPLDRPLASVQVLDDAQDLLVIYALAEGDGLRAARYRRAARAWAAAPLAWRASPGGPHALEAEWCRGALALRRFPGGFLAGAHINPSAECTIVLGPDLAVRGVLAGWPVTTLPDGRIVYQRNQVHFAAVHPVELALFDPGRPGDVAIYPRRPDPPIRRAHVDRMRAVYTQAWCSARNHPCDPDRFDEHVASEVVTDARGDALAFVMAWDNTTGWSDAERWGRLEPFREVRAALGGWDGRGEPPADLYRSLAAGLARARNLKAEGHVADALADDAVLAPLVAAALASTPAAGQDARAWLLGLDGRWADPATWRRLGQAVTVPEEFTEVVYVHAGLRSAGPSRYRELLRRDFEARFGPGAPGRALEPDVLRRLFAAPQP